ncbi:MAG TPA: 50S ribosomal protein L24 [Candidatus Dormibacteraeota bacterium]|nr:50S ribosomal protein L24 [Candidatus Dormibacteraeota bacterium]
MPLRRVRRTPAQRLKVALKHEGWAHGSARPLDIRSGDTVVVLAGKDKGKRGKVERTIPEEQRIVVAGVNVLKRHTKAGVRGNIQGGIVDFNGPIAYSNVMLVCNRCDKPTRISKRRLDDGTYAMFCRQCGEKYERGAV